MIRNTTSMGLSGDTGEESRWRQEVSGFQGIDEFVSRVVSEAQ